MKKKDKQIYLCVIERKKNGKCNLNREFRKLIYKSFYCTLHYFIIYDICEKHKITY